VVVSGTVVITSDEFVGLVDVNMSVFSTR